MGEIWDVTFDVAAVIVLLVLFMWYLVEKRIPLRSHTVFLELITCAFVAASLEILTATYVSGQDYMKDSLFEWLFALQMVFTYMEAVLFYWYALVLAHLDRKAMKKRTYFIVAAGVLVIGVNLMNPVTRWAYYFSNFRYYTNWAGYILYALAVVMIIAAMVVLFGRVREVTLSKASLFTLNILFIAAALYVQMKFGTSILNFSIAIGCLTLYQYLNNPGDMTDETTGLFNRNLFGIFVKNEFTAGREFGVIVIAMDDFKFINKNYGVTTGDDMLRQIASYLISVRNSDRVFRFGSDQFCMVVRKDTRNLEDIAQKIQDRFRHPWYGESSDGIMMSASICCIACPKDAFSYENLIEVIDYSMLVAKKTNKGGISHAENLMLDVLKEDKAIEKAVKLAIDRNELMVYYQPIYSVSKGQYNSAEALVRLNDSQLGWISPEKFIPIAEKNGLIVQMGEIILEKVCRFIHDNDLKNTSIEYIEVNISPIQLVQADFVERVKNILEKYDVSPSQINMEITETATMTGASVINDNIAALVDYGIKFSLDDYGSGNANIDYINNMPFSIIKLDKFIIWDAFKSEKAGITLEYTVGMLNALQLHIVAEGVETEEMKERLSEVGCHYMQGWYYSKAVADDEFMKLIA
jgi:diguanylate cyclase (GGDEF)-like protein